MEMILRYMNRQLRCREGNKRCATRCNSRWRVCKLALEAVKGELRVLADLRERSGEVMKSAHNCLSALLSTIAVPTEPTDFLFGERTEAKSNHDLLSAYLLEHTFEVDAPLTLELRLLLRGVANTSLPCNLFFKFLSTPRKALEGVFGVRRGRG
jgi:hypothetical protein